MLSAKLTTSLPRNRPLIVSLLTALPSSVWHYHGYDTNLLHGSPRQLLIDQSVPVLAGAVGRMALIIIGAGEMLLALWVISGRAARLCAATQTIILLSMNALELTFARSHLLSPPMLVPVNLLFLCC